MRERTEELIARIVHAHFPGTLFVTENVDGVHVFRILHDDQDVISFDSEGVSTFFKVRGKNRTSWRSFLEGRPETIAQSYLQDLADADFKVIGSKGEPISKRRLNINKNTFCPGCNQRGSIRKIFYGLPSEPTDSEKYISGGCCVEADNPEIQCVSCNWSGLIEAVRFVKPTPKDDSK
jgi:hypothetical protein